MNLGEILSTAVIKDLAAGNNENGLVYTELMKEGKFAIKLSSIVFPDAFIECSIPNSLLNDNTEDEKNYAIVYFLSMSFNAVIHGMKIFKHKKNKK